MKNMPFRTVAVTAIRYLYVLLFVYAAVSKLWDFENFQVQLGQSPLLSAFAGSLAWLVPLLELLLAAVLCIPRFARLGLLGGFALMVLFTFYIHLILHYSSYVPCSCGGVLERMNWQEHLYFNIAFCVLALLALYLTAENRLYLSVRIFVVVVVGGLLMVGLHQRSEALVFERNAFVRSFPPFPAQRDRLLQLDAEGYYFAGKGEGKLYLGHPTAPALITTVDTCLAPPTTSHFQIRDTLFPFLNVKLAVAPPHFLVYDGKVPCVFKGRLDELKAVLQTERLPGFTKAKVADSATLILRMLSPSREHLLATLDVEDGTVRPSPTLLQKQKDGLFDTDGMLQYSPELERFVYLYYYRNQYVLADKQLQLLGRGNTIDTTTQAALKIRYVSSKQERQFAAPPLMVNRLSALHRNLLFVHSTLPSRHEEKRMWKNAHVLDVYDILTQTYVLSFYVYKVDGEQLDDMVVTDTHLYALMGPKLVAYRLNASLYERFYHNRLLAK